LSVGLGTSGVLLLAAGISAVRLGFGEAAPPVSANAANIYLDRGAAGLARCLAALNTRASLLMITAHPDDEDGGLLAYQTRGLGARGALMTLTRGEGGQNAMSTDIYDALGLMRTQELLAAGQYYGVDQYWGHVIDYGFSKTREEALEKWGYDRVLSDVVRVVRMTRPLVLTSVFVGAPTDGHGNHQVAGQMAQEAFVAAGDPNRYPEQIKEGLRPWSPLKVYERVPFFTPTKENTIYDYATDKYVPIRFFDYINKTWITQRPTTTIDFPEGEQNPASGVTYAQMGREGWGFQKSQNGGGTLPQPSIVTTHYHRYGSKIAAAEKENSFYDGIDVSLNGIASLASEDTGFLKEGLAEIAKCVGVAQTQFNPNHPATIAPQLADGLKGVRTLLQKVQGSGLSEPGKDDVLFELESKERQFEKALVLALGVSFDSVVGPEREPTGPFAAFGGPAATFTIAIPGQQFTVQGNLYNQGQEQVNVAGIGIKATDGKRWSFKPDKETPAALAGGKDVRLRFAVHAPEDAGITKPYYSRPDQEQPYYDLLDERFRNASVAPYPLLATARLSYRGEQFSLRKVVQTYQRLEGIGLVEQPLLMGPPVSVTVYPGAGAVPTSVKGFTFSCVLHSNVKGPAEGVLRLKLPEGWESTPAEHAFHIMRDGENETVSFQVQPHSVAERGYEIKAVAEYKGKSYEDGYRMTGYPGLRPYPYYRPAVYKAVGVDVQTAPNLNVGFFPGTGDEVPRALQDLGLNVQILSGSDIENGNLKNFDAIVLGVRAYAVRPELRAANNRLLEYVKAGGVVLVQYNLQNFDRDYGPYPFTLGSNPEKVVDESSTIRFLDPKNPALTWPNRISEADFRGWEEERGHGFMQKWDPHYEALVETHDPDQKPQAGGLLMARYGKGFYVYDAFALYRQLPAGVPGAYRLLANLVSLGKNPEWK
jgi:LmbE family N-acetylglucosaminyl deacetylase